MTVLRLTTDYQTQYSEFVAAHPSGSFLQSWSWGEFQTSQGKNAIRYGVYNEAQEAQIDGSNKLLATVQLFHTKIPHLPGTYLYAPYGPLVSAKLETKEQKEILELLLSKIKADYAKVWFIRLEPKDELSIDAKPTLHIQPGSTLLTDLSQPSEVLLANMHQKTRYNIKVANKHGVTVSQNPTELPIRKQALSLLVDTSNRQRYKSYSLTYYEQLLDFFTPAQSTYDCQVHLYFALANKNPIASAIMIDHGQTRTYLFGGSDNSQRQLMAPYALHWQAMQDGQEKHLTTYDWWGTETANGTTPGFVQFKLRWGGVQKFYTSARDIVLNGPWYKAYQALRKVNRLI
jgi:lipid II:glycine glycyltransferase (peptidoglycan interpeptide bridge formation enzyme)